MLWVDEVDVLNTIGKLMCARQFFLYFCLLYRLIGIDALYYFHYKEVTNLFRFVGSSCWHIKHTGMYRHLYEGGY